MIHINFNFNENSGGGLTFLSYLKKYLISKGYYSNSVFNSKYILMNSHHKALSNIFLKIFFKNKIFIHRIDGPIKLYNSEIDFRDKIVKILNKISDFDIYQSYWSRKKNLELLITNSKSNTVIPNGSTIKNNLKTKTHSKKIKIIISSYSSNFNKGFKYFEYLDEVVDIKKFDINFYGNSKIKFKNIKDNGTVTNNLLKDKIRKSDLAIIASKNDPCSNFLIECINSKLDILVLNSGGHSELVNNKNCFFRNELELLNKLRKYKKNTLINFKTYDLNYSCDAYFKSMISINKKNKILFEDLIVLCNYFIIIIYSKLNRISKFFHK